MSITMPRQFAPEHSSGMIDKLMDETLKLAEDAKAYLINRPKRQPEQGNELPYLVETAEMGRVSARVSHCMAWLLARKAVAAGEITEAEAKDPKWRLGDHDLCESLPDQTVPISVPLQHISGRSLALYERISRLDRDLGTQH